MAVTAFKFSSHSPDRAWRSLMHGQHTAQGQNPYEPHQDWHRVRDELPGKTKADKDSDAPEPAPVPPDKGCSDNPLIKIMQA